MPRIISKKLLIYMIAILIFLWAISQVNLFDVVQTLKKLTLLEIGTLMLLNIIIWGFNSRRWAVLLTDYKVPLPTILLHRFSGFAVSYFTPGPQFGGEPLQVYLLTKIHNIPVPFAISSVTMDKVINIFVNFVVLAFFCVLCRSVFPFIDYIFLSVVALIVFFAIVFLFYKSGRTIFDKAFSKLCPQKITDMIVHSEKSMGELLFSKAWWYGIFLSFCAWGIMIGEYWLCFYFLGQTLTFLQTISLLLTMHFALLIPIPGGWGAVESSQVIALCFVGLDPAVGIGVIALVRVRDIIISGIGFWWMHHILAKRTSKVFNTIQF